MTRATAVLAALCVLAGVAFGHQTWYVPDRFPTIQSAINHELVLPGDTIAVWGEGDPPYVYNTQNIVCGKANPVGTLGFIPGQVSEEPDWGYVVIVGR